MSAEQRTAVLDASVIVALYVEESLSSAAAAAVGRLQHEGHSLHAPELLLHEVSNAFAKAARHGVLTTDQSLEHLGALASSEIEMHAAAEVARAAMALALAHGISAHDAAYLALALRLDAALVTGDRAFATRARATGVSIESIESA